jgi:hypothetical protein
LLNLLGASAGHLNKNIDHWNDNLRFLFPWESIEGGQPQQYGGYDDERSELGINK